MANNNNLNMHSHRSSSAVSNLIIVNHAKCKRSISFRITGRQSKEQNSGITGENLNKMHLDSYNS